MLWWGEAHLSGLSHPLTNFLGKFFWTFGLNLDESCIFVRSNLSLSAPNLGVLCTPDRPPPFVWSLAGEVGRAVLSRTDEEEDEGDNREERRERETRKRKRE